MPTKATKRVVRRRKTAPKPTNERIYTVIANTVWTPEKGVVRQVPGRAAMQGTHAVSRMKMHLMLDMTRREQRVFAKKAITTISLGARDAKELQHIMGLLEKAGIRYYTFEDENPPVYGKGEFLTAISTVPVDPEQLVGITDYLPLWNSENA